MNHLTFQTYKEIVFCIHERCRNDIVEIVVFVKEEGKFASDEIRNNFVIADLGRILDKYLAKCPEVHLSVDYSVWKSISLAERVSSLRVLQEKYRRFGTILRVKFLNL